MIRSKLIVCADYIILDAPSNSVTVFNLFEDITPEGFPIFIPRLSVLSILEKDVDDPPTVVTKLEIRIDDQVLFSGEIPIDFQDKRRSRHITVLGGMPIPKPGLLIATLSIGEREIHSYSVEVNPSKAQPQVREQKAAYG